MENSKFEEVFVSALQVMIAKNGILIQKNLKEECINSAFLNVLKDQFGNYTELEELDYDLEYDKHLDVQKSMPELGAIRPDIVIHQRGSDENNFLFLEAKKRYLNKRDRSKLKTSKLSPFSYRFAVGLEYHPKKHYFRYCILDSSYQGDDSYHWKHQSKA